MANKVEIQIIGNNVMAVNAIDGVKTKLGTLQTKVNSTTDAMIDRFKMFGAGLATYFSVDAIGRFVLKSSQLAREFEEVNNSFRRMPQNTYLLERMRQATENTVSDLNLMKLALQAKNFNIPLELLAKGLEFSKMRSEQLGESIESMFSAFTRGMAKESTKTFTTLGISTRDFKEELKLSGNYGIALGNIMERELAKVDRAFVSSQDKVDQFNAKLENTQTALGKKWAPIERHLENEALDFLTRMGKFFNLDEKIINNSSQLPEWLNSNLKGIGGKYVEIVDKKEKIVDLTHREINAVSKLNEDYQHLLNKESRRLEARGYEDAGGMGVELIPAPSMDLTNYISAIEMQKQLITEVTDYELAALFLRSEAAQQTFGDMAGAMMSFYQMGAEGSRTFFDLYKVFAAGEAAIAAYDAATKVFAATAFMYPFNYVAAGAALTFGLSNVARILSMQPGGGGGGGGGGSAPSVPSGGNTTNNNVKRNYIVNVTYMGSGRPDDPDRFAREMLEYFRKAERDGG